MTRTAQKGSPGRAPTYADHVAAGEMPPPRTAFEHLLYGMGPITSEDPSPVVLSTRIRGGEIVAHRYLPQVPPGTPPEVARAYCAWRDERVPWIPGPPPYVLRAMAGASPAAKGDGSTETT